MLQSKEKKYGIDTFRESLREDWESYINKKIEKEKSSEE